MKTRRYVLALLGVCIGWTLCHGQAASNTCSAAFLGKKMIVDSYTPGGRCRLSIRSAGQLTVNTVDLLATDGRAVARIPFTVAIRDGQTKTLTQFSREAVQQLNVKNVLARCRKGDAIVLLTTNRQYALPHNEILVR